MPRYDADGHTWDEAATIAGFRSYGRLTQPSWSTTSSPAGDGRPAPRQARSHGHDPWILAGRLAAPRGEVYNPHQGGGDDRQSDGWLHGTGTLHVTFFNQYVNGCPTTFEGDVPLTIIVVPENRNDAGEIAVKPSGPDFPYFNMTSPDCMFVDDIATEIQAWVGGVLFRAAPDRGPNKESMTVPGGTWTSTTTMTR